MRAISYGSRAEAPSVEVREKLLPRNKPLLAVEKGLVLGSSLEVAKTKSTDVSVLSEQTLRTQVPMGASS